VDTPTTDEVIHDHKRSSMTKCQAVTASPRSGFLLFSPITVTLSAMLRDRSTLREVLTLLRVPSLILERSLKRTRYQVGPFWPRNDLRGPVAPHPHDMAGSRPPVLIEISDADSEACTSARVPSALSKTIR
jgi:hypothetical protein